MDDILGDIMGGDYEEEVDYEDADDVVVAAKVVPEEQEPTKDTSTAPKNDETPSVDHSPNPQRKDSQAPPPLAPSLQQQHQKRRPSPPRGPRRNNSSGVNATPIGVRRIIDPVRREADTYRPERDRTREGRGSLPPRRPLSPRRGPPASPAPRDGLPPRSRAPTNIPRGTIDDRRNDPARGLSPSRDRDRDRDRSANDPTSLDSKPERRQPPRQSLERYEANDGERLQGPNRSPPRQAPPLRRNDSLPDRGDRGPQRGPPGDLPRGRRDVPRNIDNRDGTSRDVPRGNRDGLPRDIPRNIDNRDGPSRDVPRDNRDGPRRDVPRDNRDGLPRDHRDGPSVKPMRGPSDKSRGNGSDSRPGPGPLRPSSPPRQRDERPRPRTPPYNMRKPAVPPNAPPPRFFLMKTSSMDNIRIAQDMDVWAASVKNQDALRAAFQAGKVYLVFSVNASGHFQGYAEMMTDIGAVAPAQWDLSDSRVQYSGTFGLRWFRRCNLEFGRSRNLYNKLNESKPVKIGYDGQEIDRDCGKALCDMLDDLPEEKPKEHSVLKDSDKKQPRKQNGIKRAASPSLEQRENDGKRQAAEGPKDTPVAAVLKDDAAVTVTKDDTAVIQVDQGGDAVMKAAKMEVDKTDRSKSAPPEPEAASNAHAATTDKAAQGLQIRGRGRGQGQAQGQKDATPNTPTTPTGPRSLADRLKVSGPENPKDRRPLKPQDSAFNNGRGGRGNRGGGGRRGGRRR